MAGTWLRSGEEGGSPSPAFEPTAPGALRNRRFGPAPFRRTQADILALLSFVVRCFVASAPGENAAWQQPTMRAGSPRKSLCRTRCTVHLRFPAAVNLAGSPRCRHVGGKKGREAGKWLVGIKIAPGPASRNKVTQRPLYARSARSRQPAPSRSIRAPNPRTGALIFCRGLAVGSRCGTQREAPLRQALGSFRRARGDVMNASFPSVPFRWLS